MREEFEGWYIVKFLQAMPDAKTSTENLRNRSGGYDDPHMDGAWEAWKHLAAKNG